MKSFFEEFKAFAVKGNVLDLAVAVVIGSAFGKIVSSLVDTLIMPTVGLLLGGVDFTGWSITVGESVIAYGKFVQSVVDFVIIAFVIFVLIRALRRMDIGKKDKGEEAPKVSEEIVLLREIRDSVRR